MPEQKRHIAYHEAGHAVMAILMGREVKSVSPKDQRTVLNSERLAAILGASGPLSAEDREHCEQELKIALAGYGGEVVGLGQPSFVTAYDSDISQGNVVHRALKERAGREGTGNALQDEVIGELTRNRDSLDRVAKALLVEGELTAERVRDLVKPSTPSKG
jgi:ATP-dependent Zn protease